MNAEKGVREGRYPAILSSLLSQRRFLPEHFKRSPGRGTNHRHTGRPHQLRPSLSEKTCVCIPRASAFAYGKQSSPEASNSPHDHIALCLLQHLPPSVIHLFAPPILPLSLVVSLSHRAATELRTKASDVGRVHRRHQRVYR